VAGAVEQKVVERKVVAAFVAYVTPLAGVAVVDYDMEVVAASRAVCGHLVSCSVVGLVVGAGQLALLCLVQQGMTAVPKGNGRGAGAVRVVLWRRRGEEVALRPVLVADIVREKVLQQTGGCLAYRGRRRGHVRWKNAGDDSVE
jgi:hypothetical protein